MVGRDDEDGQTLVEYTAILAFVSIVAVVIETQIGLPVVDLLDGVLEDRPHIRDAVRRPGVDVEVGATAPAPRVARIGTSAGPHRTRDLAHAAGPWASQIRANRVDHWSGARATIRSNDAAAAATVALASLAQKERDDLARAVYRADADWRLPTLWRHEYLNVLASAVRFRKTPLGFIPAVDGGSDAADQDAEGAQNHRQGGELEHEAAAPAGGGEEEREQGRDAGH